MGTITSNIGLVSGINYQDLVNKLIEVQSGPVKKQTLLIQQFSQQRTALTSLEASLIALQFSTNRLSTSSLFNQRTATSVDDTVLSATVTGTPPLGQYQLTPVRLAQSQQLQSSRFASTTSTLGAGTLTLRHGGFVDRATSLDLLNSGEGFTRGKIKITDRSGASATIDLRFARDVDDILDAINNAEIGIEAQATGDQLRLVDTTGQTTSNLKVEEVSGGTTAASLGLDGINVAANEATGTDVLELFDDLTLSLLNDGVGVRFNSVLPDLQISFRDGTTSTVDFRRIGVTGTKPSDTTDAANGVNARVKFSAVEAGSAYDGVTVSFVDDAGVTAGNETVVYDDLLQTLTFHIDAGFTTADNIVDAVLADEDVSELFAAARAVGGDGSGLIDTADTAVLAGPQATAISPGTLSNDAKVVFTAVEGGSDFNDIDIEFVDNAGITAGNETVVYDDSNPSDKKLIFQIDAGNTTAVNVIDALNNDATASQIFTATDANGSDGTGIISVLDTVTTAGGNIVEPIAATNELTLKEVVDALNDAAAGKLEASIGPDGDRLVLTDLTTDTGGTFAVSALNDSDSAYDLGLDTIAAADTLTGRRLLGGLKTALLSSLNGGAGYDTLGEIDITDRSGASATVNLASAESLDDVVSAINAAGLGVEAEINDARNGILIVDTTGATASNLIIANGDATNTADQLGVAVNAAATSQSSGNLKLHIVSENTLLSSLNGGSGVGSGTLRITDTEGESATLTVNSSIKTIGDLLHAIDLLGLAIEARVNDAGDGIVIIDTADGPSDLAVSSLSGKAAHDLHLLGGTQTVDIVGTPTQVVDGSTALSITLSATDTLEDLLEKINEADIGVQAAAISDGSLVKPYRLTLFNSRSGKAGELLIDSSGVDFSFQDTLQAQDALVVLGSVDSPSSTLASSSSNTFGSLLPGLSIGVKNTAAAPVTITVGSTNTSLTTALQGMVDAYNKVRSQVVQLTKFDTTTNTAAVLQGDGTVLRVETGLSDLITRRVFGAGTIQTLAQLGISPDDEGTLQFDQSVFQTLYDQDPEAVEDFLATKDSGIADRFKVLIDSLADEDSSLLVSRAEALSRKIDDGEERVDFLTARLEAQRERLLKQFQASELLIAKIQANLSAINSIQPFFFQTNNQRNN